VCQNVIAQLIKGTLGITGLSLFRVQIDVAPRHLDVECWQPPGAEAGKGSTVRRLKPNLIWVQTAVRQVGLYGKLLWKEEN